MLAWLAARDFQHHDKSFFHKSIEPIRIGTFDNHRKRTGQVICIWMIGGPSHWKVDVENKHRDIRFTVFIMAFSTGSAPTLKVKALNAIAVGLKTGSVTVQSSRGLSCAVSLVHSFRDNLFVAPNYFCECSHKAQLLVAWVVPTRRCRDGNEKRTNKNIALGKGQTPCPSAGSPGLPPVATKASWLQVCTLSSFSALIFCLLFHQGKSKREKVIAGWFCDLHEHPIQLWFWSHKQGCVWFLLL